MLCTEDALTQATVGETMDKDAPFIAADTEVGVLAERIGRHDPAVVRRQALLILDASGKLVGIITRGDVLRAIDKDPSGGMTVQEAGKTHLVVTYPDELVSEAAAKMLRFDIGRLPVWSAGMSGAWWDIWDGARFFPLGCDAFTTSMSSSGDGWRLPK